MKLKTITLIAAILFAISSATQCIIFIMLLLMGSEYTILEDMATMICLILRDIAASLFFFTLYKNQK